MDYKFSKRNGEKIEMQTTVEWEENVKKKVRYMTNYVWDGISPTTQEKFINNFDDANKMIGWALLDMLIYYSSEQEESVIANLMRLLKRDFWIKLEKENADLLSEEIDMELDNIFKRSCFVPVDDSDPSASSFALSSQFKKSEEVSKFIEYIDVQDVPLKMTLGKDYFIFYDDLIGTGKQFDTFWKNKRFGKNKAYSLEDLAKENTQISFYYLALGGCYDGIEKLKREIPCVKVLVSEFFSNSSDIFCDKNEYWEFNADKKDEILNYIKDKENELGARSRFSKNIPVLFQHGRAPNTAFSLYWYNKEGAWNGLYRR